VTLIFGSSRDITRDLETTAELTRIGYTLQSIVASVSDSYCTFDHNLRLTNANSAALAWMQVAEEDAIGRPMIALPAGDFSEAIVDAIMTREVVRLEVESVLKPGRWLECTAYPSPEGNTSVFFRDVTDRIEVRQEAERAQGLLRASIDALSALVALTDREGRIVTSNAAWNRHFKDSEGGSLGCLDALRSALQDGDAVAACGGIADLLAGRRDGFRGVYRRRDRWFQLTASRFRFGGEVLAVIALEDVTEARLARQEATELSHQLVGLQEEERQRIASELHDSTFQHLVGMSLNLMRLTERQDDAGREILEEINGALEQAMREIRIFSYLLYPTSLSTDGLVATLERFVLGFQQRTGLDVRLTAAEAIDGLPLELQTCALRVVQEALLNAYKHAGATRLSVNARLFRGSLVLRVRDNGYGIAGKIADDDVSGAGIRLGVGIPAMRARIRYFGGALVIRGKPCGTTVLAAIEVPKAKAGAVRVLADFPTKIAS
jgi:signal transduction histidine kinase